MKLVWLFLVGLLGLPAVAETTDLGDAQTEDRVAVLLELSRTFEAQGDLTGAATRALEAAELEPRNVDLWLNAQRVRVAQSDWIGVLDAGNQALALLPQSYWARIRNALAFYMISNFRKAEKEYQTLLDARPGDPEARLGLGFCRVMLGSAEIGHTLCAAAGRHLPSDERVASCLAMQGPVGVAYSIGGSAFASYYHYTNPWNTSRVASVIVTAAVDHHQGLGGFVGAAMSLVGQRYSRDDSRQLAAVVGLHYEAERYEIHGGGGYLFSDAADTRGTLIGSLGGVTRPKPLGFGGETAVSIYPHLIAWQADPALMLQLPAHFVLSVGPGLVLVSADAAHLSGSEPFALHWSGRARIDWGPLPCLSFWLGGFGGERQYEVAAAGLSVWTSDDVFIGGYLAGASLLLGEHVKLTAEWLQRFGALQAGLEHRFSVLGAAVGIGASL